MIETAPQAKKVASAMTEVVHETLVSGFRRQVVERPGEAAMYFRGSDAGMDRYVSISWSTFAGASDRIAAYLLSEGVAEEDHVAIWAGNRPEWHIADIATLSLRCRPVPVYLTLSAEQAGYVLGHSESRVVFVEDEKLMERVLEVRQKLPSLTRIVVMRYSKSSSHDGFVISWAEALQRGQADVAKVKPEIERRVKAVAPSDVATLIYTSGTTGPPKAVLLTHANISATIAALDTFVHLGPEDRVLSYLPLAHVAERLISEFRSYIKGNSVYFLDGLPHLGQRLAEVRPTQFFGVPRVWEKMAQTIRTKLTNAPLPRKQIAAWALRVGSQVVEAQQADRPISQSLARRYRRADKLVLSKVRAQLGFDQVSILATGAAPIDAEVLRFFASLGLEICEVYGQTEDCGITTINRPGFAKFGTVGTKLPKIEVQIAEDGEILVRGGNVFAGYYKDEKATAETLIDGWLHTGDVGEFDDHAYLRITDRKKDLIITAGGKNISPSNIEGMICRLDLISHAVAIGDRRPFVSALITLDPEQVKAWRGADGNVTDAARQQVDAQVASVNKQLSQVEQVKKWKILDGDFEICDELTPTMKVKRKVVTEKYATQIGLRIHVLTASGELEPYQADIERSLRHAWPDIDGLLGLRDLDVVVSHSTTNVMAETGVGGYGPTGYEVQLWLDASRVDVAEIIEVHLPETLAHEAHHSARWRGPGYGVTLLDALVTEGLAQHFQTEFDGSTPVSAIPFDAGEATWIVDHIGPSLEDAGYDHTAWFLADTGVIPRWTGYRLGYMVIADYLRRNPNETASSLANWPSGWVRRARRRRSARQWAKTPSRSSCRAIGCSRVATRRAGSQPLGGRVPSSSCWRWKACN